MNVRPTLLLLALSSPLLLAQPDSRPAPPPNRDLLTHAGAEKIQAEVRAADDERVAATLAGDGARLDAVLSEGLYYAHSSGAIDTKAAFIGALTSKRVTYEAITYLKREFLLAGDDIVLMTGRGRFRAGLTGQPNELDLNFLGVWRREAGRWRFLAWQSSRNPPPAPPPPAPPPPR